MSMSKQNGRDVDGWSYIKTKNKQEIFCPPSTNNCCAFFAISACMGFPVQDSTVAYQTVRSNIETFGQNRLDVHFDPTNFGGCAPADI